MRNSLHPSANAPNILVIGTGQLGSRHLQALKLLETQANIYALDQDPDSLQAARERVNEVDMHTENHFLFTTEEADLPGTLDVVIVATTARTRLRAMQQVSKSRTIRNFILEKVLFQTLDEYDQARELLLRANAQAWVNCPRRMMRFFKDLGSYFDNASPTHYRVSGTNWGLATNAIHHIDNLAMYAGTQSFELDTSGLEPELRESKRTGYIELMGTLAGRFASGAEFELSCESGSKWSQVTSIGNAATRVTFRIPEEQATLERSDRATTAEPLPFVLVRQSQLTHLAVSDILSAQTCDLPTFQDSTKLHLPLIEGLLRFVSSVAGKPVHRLAIT